MSDFTSTFWSLYVTILTLASIVCCAVLLWVTSRQRNVVSPGSTTGHVWDVDLAEGNHPLPRWWVWLFVITIVFALVYLALYPGLGSSKGLLDWSSIGQYEDEMARGARETAPLYARFTAMPVEAVARDPQAMAIGDRLFMNNCAQCHGSDAHGSKGFPNLADGDWLHGGTPVDITETITQGRIGVMPPMGAALGSQETVRNVAHYVLSLSGSPHDTRRAALGKPAFAVCAACHGADGKGNTAIGSANLTDDVWLHGFGEQAIMNMINNGKTNQMPAQSSKLTPAQIHVLASYVWGLSRPVGAAH
jgi:cytochrome c oxidase cbb3-type subunit 3